ncbi:angiomotin-like protein 1 isoform X2 [Colossoma macropomum]|uniref:angiomotin-like protein 1 isoform X2 n=1 Tax=Colossoma macropomum TaxID=42526 RepID=UPI001863F40F|nr:angiomotin-like protein 1 isoform X2 [Colossoma macropomum]
MDPGDWIPDDVAQWLDQIGIHQHQQSLDLLYGEVAQLFGVCPYPTAPPALGASMRSSEDGVSGTVLQRLMQEHLRYGTGGTVGGSENDSIIGVPHMLSPSNPVSTENLLLEEDGHLVPFCQPVPPQTQPRQEPQGQEHQVDSCSMEKNGGQNSGGSVQGTLSVPGLGNLELPSYEEAKTQSQLFRGQHSQNDQQITSQSLGYTHASLQNSNQTVQNNAHLSQNLQSQASLKTNQQNLISQHQGPQTQQQQYYNPTSTSSCPPSLSSAPSLSSPPSLSSSSSCLSAVPMKARVEGRAWVQRGFIGVTPPRDEGLAELKEGHVRSLSERIMQLSLERNGAKQSRGPSSPSPKETSERPENSPSPISKSSKTTAPPPPPPLPSIKTSLDHRGPPPEYPFKLRTQSVYPSSISPGPQSLELSNEPSLTSSLIPHQVALPQYQPQSPIQLQSHPGQLVPGDTFAMVSQAQQMLAVLSEENQRLRQEVLTQSEKASKLQRLEAEVGRLSDAYESLVKSSSKRESLDKTMRLRLEGEIRRLHDFNRDLRDRLETANRQLANQEAEGQEDSRLYLNERRESIKEMERLEMEADTLRSASEDQRRHIEILEQALNNAQSKVVRLEEELGKKQVYVERVERLQLALGQLQAACEKREQLEKRLRTRLERELEALRSQQRAGVGMALPAACESSAPALLDLLREREERILGLEADMMRWEQKYLEESAMRQFAMEAAATAAAQRDTTIIQHSRSGSYSDGCLWQHEGDDKTHSRRCQDIETRMKDLHAQLLEKDAMIKVLQQRSRRDSAPLRPARSTPSIAIATGLHSRQTSRTERGELQSWKGSASVLLGKESMEHLPPAVPSFSASLSSLPPSLSSSLAPSLSSSLPPSLSSSLAPSFPLPSSSTLPLLSCSLPLSSSSATLPLPSTLPPLPPPLSSSLPSTPLLSLHSKSASRDSSTQMGRNPEILRTTPPTGRAKSGKTDSLPTQTKPPEYPAVPASGQKIRLPDSDLVEILI